MENFNKNKINDTNTLLSDISKVMLDNKIKLVKQKIEQISEKHQYYMEISSGDGSRATEILENKQNKLFKLLDKLQSYSEQTN